jgi:ribulose-phosphate 3-epimerase
MIIMYVFMKKLNEESRGINMTKLAPSILSADFARLGEEIQEVDRLGVDYIHVDVMDGHFVPNITLGPQIVQAIRPITELPLDVHLMICNPDQFIPAFADAGADIITVHQEVCPHLHRTIQLIKDQGVKAGVVINPATPVEMLLPILPDVDMVLIMTVNPGFGGQSFIESTIGKIKLVNKWRHDFGFNFEIEVDGGIKPKTAKICTDAGADVLVAGSAIFAEEDRKQAIQEILNAVKGTV